MTSPATAHLDALLAHTPLPALGHDHTRTAEHLILLIHRGVDWEVWGTHRRARYWDALADRARAATYAGPTLSQWWQNICAAITSTPRTAEDRAALAVLLAHPEQRAVLDALHAHAPTLVLRIRVAAEARTAAHQQDAT